MAGLAHGVATVSTRGRMSEPVWSETGCVALAPEDDPGRVRCRGREAPRLPLDPRALGALGRQVYEERFSWDRTVADTRAGRRASGRDTRATDPDNDMQRSIPPRQRRLREDRRDGPRQLRAGLVPGAAGRRGPPGRVPRRGRPARPPEPDAPPRPEAAELVPAGASRPRPGRPKVGQPGRGAGGRVVVNGGNCRWGDVNWLHHLNVLDTPAARRRRRPAAPSPPRLPALHARGPRRALRMARVIVTTCERNKRDLIEWLGIPTSGSDVVYYGTDPDVFRPGRTRERAALRARLGWPEDRPVVAFVGALGDRRKGFDTLFEAWPTLCRDPGWDADLVVVGGGAELPAWKERAEAAGLGARDPLPRVPPRRARPLPRLRRPRPALALRGVLARHPGSPLLRHPRPRHADGRDRRTLPRRAPRPADPRPRGRVRPGRPAAELARSEPAHTPRPSSRSPSSFVARPGTTWPSS